MWGCCCQALLVDLSGGGRWARRACLIPRGWPHEAAGPGDWRVPLPGPAQPLQRQPSTTFPALRVAAPPPVPSRWSLVFFQGLSVT